MNYGILFLIILSTLSFYTTAQHSFATCTDDEECKLHTQCDEFKALTAKGRLTKDERKYFSSKMCKVVNREYHVCCGMKKSDDPLPTTSSPQVTIKLPEAPQCGFYFGDKIVGGEETIIDEYPWVAKLMYKKPRNKFDSHCGGSLINERYVLSAAHCEKRIPPTWNLTAVRLGDWDTRTNPDCQEFENEQLCNDPYIDVEIIQKLVHPGYIPLDPSQPNDIMLLKLENDVAFTKWVLPICLPLDSSVSSLDFTKLALEVAGFGKTENGTGSEIKQKLDVDGVKSDHCAKFYEPKKVTITSYQICAGGEEGRDSCGGDSGGPLMRYGNFPNSKYPYYLLVGIVSFGPKKCGTKDAPGVYTLVSEYINWISNNLN